MSRGLSARQRQALALLVASKRSLDVTEELLPEIGLEPTDSSRRSLLRAMRILRDRGLVTLDRVPSGRGGWPRYLVAAHASAEGEFVGGELQRAREHFPKRTPTAPPKKTRAIPRGGWSGPNLRDAVEWRLGRSSFRGYVQYEYLDDDGKRSPEWAATRIRIRAYYMYTGEPLDPIEKALRSVEGLVELERIEPGERRRDDRRPQVIAVYERRPSP